MSRRFLQFANIPADRPACARRHLSAGTVSACSSDHVQLSSARLPPSTRIWRQSHCKLLPALLVAPNHQTTGQQLRNLSTPSHGLAACPCHDPPLSTAQAHHSPLQLVIGLL